jgi:hypothetical protein
MIARASSMGRLLKCPASKIAPGVDIDDSGDIAEAGTRMHVIFEKIVHGKKYNKPDDESEQAIIESFLEFWKSVKDDITIIGTEIKKEFEITHGEFIVTISGHIDFLGLWNDKLIILDWKTGFIDRDHSPQLKSYGFLALTDHIDYNELLLGAVNPRTDKFDIEETTSEGIGAWIAEAVKRLQEDQYSPGGHCGFCPLKFECEAKRQMMISVRGSLMEEGFGLPSAGDFADFYPKVQLLEKKIAQFKDSFRDILQHKKAVSKDKMEYFLTNVQRKSIKTDSVLIKFLKDIFKTIPFDVVKIDKTALLKKIGDRAPQGKKEERKEAFMKKLEEFGCIEISESKKITYKKEKK